MKREFLASGLVAALMAAPIGFASAADQAPPTGTPGPTTVPERAAPQAAPETAPKAADLGAGTSEATPTGAAPERKLLSAEDLRDKTVYDQEDGKVGTVKGIAGSAGEGGQAIVKIGGIMGFGGKNVAVPIQHFQVKPDGRLVVMLTEEELEEFPEVRMEDMSAIGKKS